MINYNDDDDMLHDKRNFSKEEAKHTHTHAVSTDNKLCSDLCSFETDKFLKPHFKFCVITTFSNHMVIFIII